MAKVKLDKIDRIILNKLLENGRMTNVELAERAGISAPPCLRRVRALEENGIIQGYHARLNPVILGYHVTVFAHVGLENQHDDLIRQFEEIVQTWDMVRECHLISGDSDFILKIVARDWDHYQKFLTTKLTAAPNVKHVKSSIGVKVVKHKPGVPIEE
jgi:DNA-binding Lrp family transcriptional regulator